jgi:hypothetical protein
MADDSQSNLPESDLSSLDTGRSEITTSRTEKEDSSSSEADDDSKDTDTESDSDQEEFDKAMFELLDRAPDVKQGMELIWSANKRLFYTRGDTIMKMLEYRMKHLEVEEESPDKQNDSNAPELEPIGEEK